MKKIAIFFIFITLIAEASDNTFIIHHPQLKEPARQSSLTYNDAITIPKMFSYQGRLTDTLGNPVPTDTYQLTFRLYTQPIGGTPFWSETQRVLVKEGLFSVLLGAVNPINTVPENGQMWLSLQVGSASELTPRLRIVSTAYSYLSQHSAYADTADYARTAPTPESVQTAANAHRLQGKDTTDFDNRYVNENQPNSITSQMIIDGTITRNDVALNFKAPYADTADYARTAPTPESVQTAANAHRLQGKDTTDFDNRYVNENQPNSINSQMIIDGTITRNDVALNFKAPYADTADYARTAPIPESVQTAANAHRLQGKDTTDFDNRYVNENQPNSVTSQMIIDRTITRNDVALNFKAPYADTADYARTAPIPESVQTAANAHRLQGKDTTDFDNRYVNENQPNSITSQMIIDRTITRNDVALNFKAPYADTADYARTAPTPESVQTAANAHRLQGKDTTDFDNRYVNENQPNSVTSQMIIDRTITRNDVALNFKAPYADTADYARTAPTPESVQTAANAHRLQGKDTTDFDNRYVNENQPNSVTSQMIIDRTITRNDVALNFKAPYADTADYARTAPTPESVQTAANAHRLQGKDTTDFDNRYVNENQPNSITSQMIIDRTITRNDVALNFKAPYADTADYARTAPTPESVQTAANAHRLQGKDTTDFDNRYVNENQPNSVTSQMIIDRTITRNDVALNFKAPYADTADYARTAPTPESVQTAANAHRLQGKDTTDFDNRYVNENQPNSITSQMIIDGTITGADLNRMGANINQVLKWNGTTWAPANDDSDNDWVRGTSDSVLYTIRPLGIARGGVNNMLYGNYRYTHINLGIACTTGTSAINYDYCTVGGGYGNKATQSYATVSGGYKNKADTAYAFVGGGSYNRANGYTAAVVGGSANIASGSYAFVGSGYGDTASGNYTFVGGGFRNKADSSYAFVGGGFRNKADSSYAFVGGGSYNRANGYTAAVVGGSANIAGNRAFVGGGYNNGASGNNSFVGGGELNKALGSYAFVGGGYWNTADSAYTFVGGGYYNRTNRNYAAVVGGSGNIASGSYAFVGGGFGNTASGNYAFVGGGYGDTASGNYATVPGGFNNIARGYSSLAAGKYARANHGGCFVWSDSTNFLLESVYTTGVNQFRVRARGGTWFFSNGPMTSGVYLAPNSNSWSGISDMKNITDFSSVDKKELLKLLAQLPIRYYRIKGQEETVKHIGPIAEDFYKAFGVGESDKAINMADADGVLFVAIQALYEENQKLREELELLKAELKKRE